MPIKNITPAEAMALTNKGAILVDIREKDEHQREHISSSHHHALSKIDMMPIQSASPVIFYCRSGNRTQVNASKLENAVKNSEVYILDGGIDAWRASRLPISKDTKQPIEMSRQVQIGAGMLVVGGFALGVLVHDSLHVLSAVVGAGLIFAGVTGFCGLARFLKLAPWNRTLASIGK